MAYWSLESDSRRLPIIRCGFAVARVAVALGITLAMQYNDFRDIEFPIFILAVFLAAWYAGTWPAVVAVLLSAACYDFFFTEPFYSFNITVRDLANFLVFMLWALVAI